MTVLDTSAVVDFLLGVGVAQQVETLMTAENELAAPDLLIFEVLAVLRREVFRAEISEDRAAGAVQDLGDLPVELFPCLPLRQRVWALRRNFTAADALFVALAEQLDEPLATKDSALAAEAAKHANVTVFEL
ncbi:MAG TPA: type II toxin-antitoxin system VapC family toxin [Coriobacteriia bacterium]|nr:type II toxin-antitoxin system VapC family toxin [Coriobacteriia bacterium]